MKKSTPVFDELIGLKPFFDDILAGKYNISAFLTKNLFDPLFIKKLWHDIVSQTATDIMVIWYTDIKYFPNKKYYKSQFMKYRHGRSGYQYLLDDRQKTIHMMISLYGGKIEGYESLDPILYVDLTQTFNGMSAGQNYQKQFLFWNEINDKNGEIRENTVRKKRFDDGLIVKLIDIVNHNLNMKGFETKGKIILRDLPQRVITNISDLQVAIGSYKIWLKHVRTNNILKAFYFMHSANKSLISTHFYLKLLSESIKQQSSNSREGKLNKGETDFKAFFDELGEYNECKAFKLSKFDFLQALALVMHFKNIKENTNNGFQSGAMKPATLRRLMTILERIDPNNDITLIPEKYLEVLRLEDVFSSGDKVKKAVFKMFNFFENYLYIKSPDIVPFSRLYLGMIVYFYENTSPDYDYLKRYFYSRMFTLDVLSTDSSKTVQSFDYLTRKWISKPFYFGNFLVEKNNMSSPDYEPNEVKGKQLSLFFESEPPDILRRKDKEVLIENFSFYN